MLNSPRKLTSFKIKLQKINMSLNTILYTSIFYTYYNKQQNNSTLNLNYHIKILVFEN